MYGNNPMFPLSVFIGVYLWLIILDTSDISCLSKIIADTINRRNPGKQ